MTEQTKNNIKLPDRLAQEGATQLTAGQLPPDMAALAANPRVMFCGDIDMHINAKGEWFYKGSMITRPRMVALFSTIMRRDSEGGYWLTTPVELTRITVEDAPFMAVELITLDESCIKFRTNVDTIVTLDEDHPLRIATDPINDGVKPYIMVKDRLEALLERSVFYQLMEMSVERESNGENVLGVWSAGIYFPIGSTN